MTTPTLIITRGVQGSGKSTFAREWVDASPNSRIRVNRDDIRFALFGKYWGVDEKAVTLVQDAALRAALGAGKDVVLDNTNLQSKNVIDVLKIAGEFGANVQFEDFPISFEEAVARDAARDRTVGEDVIRSYFDRFMRGTKNPQFPDIPTLPEEWVFPRYEAIDGLPSAVLVDIDGTLAHSGQYDVYDGTKHHLHEFDQVVSNAVYSYARYAGAPPAKIIVMSGRDATWKKVLENWLADHGFVYDELYMRGVGDQRNDAIVKNELFERYIAGNYNVDIIFDDRDRVVKMWRQKGLRVFQVAPGDF